jgi:hypothetical protein
VAHQQHTHDRHDEQDEYGGQQSQLLADLNQ